MATHLESRYNDGRVQGDDHVDDRERQDDVQLLPPNLPFRVDRSWSGGVGLYVSFRFMARVSLPRHCRLRRRRLFDSVASAFLHVQGAGCRFHCDGTRGLSICRRVGRRTKRGGKGKRCSVDPQYETSKSCWAGILYIYMVTTNVTKAIPLHVILYLHIVTPNGMLLLTYVCGQDVWEKLPPCRSQPRLKHKRGGGRQRVSCTACD